MNIYTCLSPFNIYLLIEVFPRVSLMFKAILFGISCRSSLSLKVCDDTIGECIEARMWLLPFTQFSPEIIGRFRLIFLMCYRIPSVGYSLLKHKFYYEQ